MSSIRQNVWGVFLGVKTGKWKGVNMLLLLRKKGKAGRLSRLMKGFTQCANRVRHKSAAIV